MGTVLDMAEALWTGATDVYAHHPFGQPHGLESIVDGVSFFKGFANTIIL